MKKVILGMVIISMLIGCNRTEKQVSNVAEKNPIGVAPTADADDHTKAASVPATELKTAANMPTDSSAKTETVANSNEPRMNATTLLASTLATAKSENKRVFVHLSADW